MPIALLTAIAAPEFSASSPDPPTRRSRLVTLSRTRSLLAASAAGVAALVILATFFWQPVSTSEDAKRVAYEVARDVALATDDEIANDETSYVPDCEEALRDPTDRA